MALVGGGVAAIGVGVALLLQSLLLVGVAVIGLGVAGIGLGIPLVCCHSGLAVWLRALISAPIDPSVADSSADAHDPPSDESDHSGS